MPNRLADETSPYLLQHRDNPVDWFPWGPEALERAKNEDMPIFLSIGYSACHWCHVMEHESFEDEETAAVMNALFVSIKVDREERPDLDSIYMQAVQSMTGRGGWPMSVFLTPDERPFYGGTYYPNTPRHGMPSFTDVLKAVADSYHNRRGDVLESADRIAGRLAPPAGSPNEMLTESILQLGTQRLGSTFDWTHGGFGGAPKFPQPMTLELLLRGYARIDQSIPHGSGSTLAGFLRLHGMKGVGCRAETDHLTKDISAAVQGMLSRLQHQYRSAFSGNESVPLGVKRPASFLRVAVASAQGPHGAEACQTQLADSCFRSTGEHNVGCAAAESLQSLADGLVRCGTGGNDG